MNGANSQVTERRYGERLVVLTNPAGESLQGAQYALYPVDEPPLVEVASIDRRWYRDVWIGRGWDVTDVEPTS